MYPLIKPLLFRLSAEQAHDATLIALRQAQTLHLPMPGIKPPASSPVQLMGLTFANPVGLAAGLDKNGDCIDGLARLGFGFLEIGTVTPKPQPGNPKPRLFRLPEKQAIINRMGFNNKGIAHLIAQVKQARFDGVLGINVGKNAATPVERAEDDYTYGIRHAYPHASYITVNLSSPNTPGLRDLQFGDALKHLLDTIKTTQQALAEQHQRYVPIAVKIAPDMEQADVRWVGNALKAAGIDGIIATNTTVSRDAVIGCAHCSEAGGLSGAPLAEASNQVIAWLRDELGADMPIIGVGGIVDGAGAAAKIAAGADLVQLYSGLIYRGPALVKEAAEAIYAQAAGQGA